MIHTEEDLENAIKGTLLNSLSENDKVAINAGRSISIPIPSPAFTEYLTQEGEESLITLVRVMNKVGNELGVEIQPRLFYIPYFHVNILDISMPDDDDDEVPLPILEPIKTMAMSAGAGAGAGRY